MWIKNQRKYNSQFPTSIIYIFIIQYYENIS